MANVFIKGDTRIGAYQFPDRKKKALCVVEGNVATVCGYFSSDELAEHFMNSLAEMFGLEEEEEEEEEEGEDKGEGEGEEPEPT